MNILEDQLDITRENAQIVLEYYLKRMDIKRYEHSNRVAKISEELAKKWNECIDDAYIAGLLHDIGKSLNKREMLSLCAKNKFTIYDFEILENITTLHGKISSLLFESAFRSHPLERFHSISHAISSHVAGTREPEKDTMSALDKIIFVADNIEPERNNDILSSIKCNKITSLDECIKMIIQDKRERALQNHRELNPLLYSTLDSIDENER